MKSSVFLAILILCPAQVAKSDFNGPSVARFAVSPDGHLIVRITTAEASDQAKDPPRPRVSFYEFNASKDSYILRSAIELSGTLAQIMYVSNAGDLVLISLDEKAAIQVYSKEGKLKKSWSLTDFLSKKEIEACAQTGSTLQWFEDGTINDREFSFCGPSRVIRALVPPYTVERGADANTKFSGWINLDTVKLTKQEPEKP